LLDPFVLLGVGALLVSGGTLAALHLLLQPGVARRRRESVAGGGGGREEEAYEEAIARYDLAKPLEEELQLFLSDEERDEQQKHEQQKEHVTAETERKLSRRARYCERRKKRAAIVGPHIKVEWWC